VAGHIIKVVSTDY